MRYVMYNTLVVVLFWGTTLVWIERLFKNLIDVPNSKSKQIKKIHNFIILDLQMFRYHYFGYFLLYTCLRKNV